MAMIAQPADLDQLTTHLFQRIEEGLGNKCPAAFLVGSRSTDQASLSRPDINFVVCLADDGPQVHLTLAKIFRSIATEFAPRYRVILEFRPFRFVTPFTKGEVDVFLSPLVVNVHEAMGPFPFGLPKYFLKGILAHRTLMFGTDVLQGLDLDFDRAYLLNGIARDLVFMKGQITRLPSCYDLNTALDLFFNECLVFGKLALNYAIYVSMTETQLRAARFVEIFNDRAKWLDAIRQAFGEEFAAGAALVFAARENYHEWKLQSREAEHLYVATYGLLGGVWLKLMQQLHPLQTGAAS